MADDRKRDEPITVKVTEQMMLDINREAARQDRSMSDFLYWNLRRILYGSIRYQEEQEGQQTRSDKVNQ